MSSFKTIAVISKAGKAGKSTVSKQLIAPMINADWIEVETINEKGIGTAMTVAGRKLDSIARYIGTSNTNIVLDIGVSNYQAFLKELVQLEDTTAAINFWVIPVQPGPAFVAEGLSTAKELYEVLMIDPARIVFIMNNVEEPEEIEKDFALVFAFCKKTGMHFVPAPIVQNPVFAIMAKREKSIFDYANERIDWDEKIQAESDNEIRNELSAEKTLRQRVRFLARNLRGVWENSPMAALTQASE